MAPDRIRAWIPGVVGGPIIAARSAVAAIVVSHLEVFPDGIEMPVAVYVRDPEVFEEPETDRPHDRRFAMRTAPWRLEPFARFDISFEVDLPDGTRLTVDNPYVPTPPPSAPPRTVAHAGIDRGNGFGAGGHLQSRIFLWPLPDHGVTRITCAWPDQQIAETVVHLDGADIRAAAERSTSVWRDGIDRPAG